MRREVEIKNRNAATISRDAASGVAFAWALAFAVAISLAVVLIPAWVIRPFRPQGQRELAVALALLRVAPVITAVLAAMGMLLVWKLWSPGWRRVPGVIAVFVLLATAVLARTDYFEFMFRPDPTPHVLALGQASLEPDDMVLVVRAGGESRAYPVRMMAYHHLVNDTVGGVALLPTY